MKISQTIFHVTVLAGCMALSSHNILAQDSTAVGQGGKPSIYWLFDNDYRLATRYNDFAQAKSSLYSLITIEPKNDSLLFNLAYLYYDNQVYASAVLVCMDVLALNPGDPGALEISALSYENLGLKDKALVSYENLYMATDNINTLYKMSYLQYELKKLSEGSVNVDIILDKAEAEEQKMIFQINEKEQKEFTLKVAALNLKGLILQAQGDKEEARKAFNDALTIAPEFVFAKQNLEKLDK